MSKTSASNLTDHDIADTKMYAAMCDALPSHMQKDIHEMLSQLLVDKPNEWNTPVPGSPLFNIYGRLFGLNVVARQKVPVWKKGEFQGYKFRFMYNFDLTY